MWINGALAKAWMQLEPLLSDRVRASVEPILGAVSTGKIVS